MNKTEVLKTIEEIEMLASSVKEEIKDAGVDIECKAYIDALLKDIKALDKNNGWIPVSERLPEGDEFKQNTDEEILYKHLLVQTNESAYIYDIAFYDQKDETWYNTQGFPCYPVAWQPLPEPYEGA